MDRRLAVLLATLGLTLGACQTLKDPAALAVKAEAARAECALTPADLAANRTLTWQQFDQQTASPTSWRSLVERKCYNAAAAAYQDYLISGPIPPGERWQTTARFHLGQSLAHAGRNEEAARIISTARRETEVGGLRWNLYVQGTVAFLTRDRAGLDAAFTALRAEPGTSNAINAGVLAGLRQCWDKPYIEASAPACVSASGYVMPKD
ncbi:MAG TPA: hypothetical protein VFV30_01355 [Novosphingobium sp.]|nr:hypothetical protein [Novosphingobium sp.]